MHSDYNKFRIEWKMMELWWTGPNRFRIMDGTHSINEFHSISMSFVFSCCGTTQKLKTISTAYSKLYGISPFRACSPLRSDGEMDLIYFWTSCSVCASNSHVLFVINISHHWLNGKYEFQTQLGSKAGRVQQKMRTKEEQKSRYESILSIFINFHFRLHLTLSN